MNNGLPDGWKFAELGSILNQIMDFRGRTPKKLGMEWGGGYIPALSANNVQMGYVDFQKECYLGSNDLYHTWMTKGATQKDDVLFTMEAPLGNVALVPDNRKYILSQRVVLLRTHKSIVHNKFLFQYLKGSSFQSQIRQLSTGSTVLGMQQKRLVKTDLLLPPLLEQKKIAKILSSVDEVIETTDTQINKLKDLKKGMMNELLTKGIGDTEFKDSPVGRIPVGWDIFTAQEMLDAQILLKLQDGNHGSQYPKVSEFVKEGIPYISASNITLTGNIDFNNCQHLSVARANGLRIPPTRSGDVIFTHNATVGRVAIIPSNIDTVIASTSTIYYRVNKCKITPEFLFQYLQSPKFKLQTDRVMGQTTRNQVPITAQKQLYILKPTLEEQQKIATILSSIDTNIEQKQTKLTQSKNLKKSLMADLLTGRVRVKP